MGSSRSGNDGGDVIRHGCSGGAEEGDLDSGEGSRDEGCHGNVAAHIVVGGIAVDGLWGSGFGAVIIEDNVHGAQGGRVDDAHDCGGHLCVRASAVSRLSGTGHFKGEMNR